MQIQLQVLTAPLSYNIRCLSNILNGFSKIAISPESLNSYTALYEELQVPLALSLRDPEKFCGKDLLGIAMAYSRTQNFSEEF